MSVLWAYELASNLRDYCIAKAWHASNTASAYYGDAENDLADIQRYEEPLRSSTELQDHFELLKAFINAAVWRAALERAEQLTLPNSPSRLAVFFGARLPVVTSDFENACDASTQADAFQNELVVDLPLAVFALARAAGWYAANTRGQFKQEARRDAAQMVRAMEALYRAPHKWRGVNLGGWLLLEKGPSSPFYENNNLVDDDGEWAATENLIEKGRLEELRLHRERHVTADTIKDIAERGFNALRVPFGYWIVTGPTGDPPDPYIGPDLDKLDEVVKWAKEQNLQVLLDLHGNPGGESQEKPCGRQHSGWSFDQWRRSEALGILRQIADRYKHNTHVTGIQVCNEPSRSRIAAKELIDHYVQCVRAIRDGGMSAEAVSIVCPLFFQGSKKKEFLEEWCRLCTHSKVLDGAVLDFHPYFFGIWAHETVCGDVFEQARRAAIDIGSVPASVVGEWSVAIYGCRDELRLKKFLDAQEELYAHHSTHGHFFWTWSDSAFGWSRKEAFLAT